MTGLNVAVVSVLDHIITGGKCYLSLREQGEGTIIETAKKEVPRCIGAGGLSDVSGQL